MVSDMAGVFHRQETSDSLHCSCRNTYRNYFVRPATAAGSVPLLCALLHGRGLPGCYGRICGSNHGLQGSKLAHMQVAWRTCSITQATHLLGAAAVTWTIKMATRRTILWRQITWTTAAAYCSTCDWLTMHMHSMLLSATLGRVSSSRAQRVSRACFYVARAVT